MQISDETNNLTQLLVGTFGLSQAEANQFAELMTKSVFEDEKILPQFNKLVRNLIQQGYKYYEVDSVFHKLKLLLLNLEEVSKFEDYWTDYQRLWEYVYDKLKAKSPEI